MILLGYRIPFGIIHCVWALLLYSLVLNLTIAILFSSQSTALLFQAKVSIVCFIIDIIILLATIGERLKRTAEWRRFFSVVKSVIGLFMLVMSILRVLSIITDRSRQFPEIQLRTDKEDYEPSLIPAGYVVLIVLTMVCDCGLLAVWWSTSIKSSVGIFAICSIMNILASILSLQINLDLMGFHFNLEMRRIYNLFAYCSCAVIAVSTIGLFISLLINDKNRLSELIGKLILLYVTLLLLILILSFACFLMTFYTASHQNENGLPISLPILFGISTLLDIVLFILTRYFRMKRQPTTLRVEEYDLNGLSDFYKSGWAKVINLNHRYNAGVNGEAIISLMSAYSSSQLEGMQCKVLRVYKRSSQEDTEFEQDGINEEDDEKSRWFYKSLKSKFRGKNSDLEYGRSQNRCESEQKHTNQPKLTFSSDGTATKENISGKNPFGKTKSRFNIKVNDNEEKQKSTCDIKVDNNGENPFRDSASERRMKDGKNLNDSFIDLEIQTSKHLDKAWNYLDKDSVLFEKGHFENFDASSLDEFKPLSKNQAKKLAKKQKDSKLQNQIEEIQADSKRFYNELMETEALVFLTIITEFDLTERIPGKLGKHLHKWFGKGSRYPILCIKFGLLGFHWPFKRSTFYCSSTKKPVARSASIMYSIAKWNRENEECTILLDPTYKDDYSETGIGFSGWIKVSLPNSHIIDLRPYKNSSLTQYFKGVKYRSQENTFKQANGKVVETFDFTTENCQIVVDMNNNIAESRTEGNQSDTLLHPTAQFIQGVGVHYNESKYRSLLYLKVNDEIIASCVIFRLGDTITSDIQGLNHEISKKYKAYFVMMQEVIRIALEEKISFVDFGPTTETAKVSIGCEVVPLVGSLCPKNQILGPIVKLAASKVEV